MGLYFLHVSNITHQQDFYNQLSKILNIQELKEDLAIELEALSSIAELEKNKKREMEKEKRQEAEKLEQERKEKNADTVLIYSTVFVVISAIAGAWDILSSLFIWDGKPLVPYPAVSALIILSAVCIMVGFLSYYFIKKKW